MRGLQEGYSTTVENVRDLNVRLIDMARANADAVFDLAHQIDTAEVPSDFAQVWSAHAKKQFEMLTKQAKELTALGQRFVGSTTEPFAHNVGERPQRE